MVAVAGSFRPLHNPTPSAPDDQSRPPPPAANHPPHDGVSVRVAGRFGHALYRPHPTCPPTVTPQVSPLTPRDRPIAPGVPCVAIGKAKGWGDWRDGVDCNGGPSLQGDLNTRGQGRMGRVCSSHPKARCRVSGGKSWPASGNSATRLLEAFRSLKTGRAASRQSRTP